MGIAALWRSVGYGLRSMRKSPGFALAVIMILGVGIGATTTIFSVVDTVVLRPLPYPEASRLVYFDRGAHSYPVFRGWEDLESLDPVAAWRNYQVDLTGQGEPRRITGVAVSRDFFRLFGGDAFIGRLLAPEDYPGDRSEVVLSHGVWVRLGSDESILGRSVRLDDMPSVVVGVLEPGFEAPRYAASAPDVWFALNDGAAFAGFEHAVSILRVAGRLAPGVAVQAAQDEMDAQRAGLAEEVPGRYVDDDGSLITTPLVAMHEATVRDVRSTLLLLMGAVAVLLLIACANVANLLLARGTGRARELALRGAMGASRSQVALQVLTESVVLALAGGAFGVVLAYGGVELFGRLMPGDVPRIEGLSVDARILAFSLFASVSTGLLFGFVPAVQSLRTNLSKTLKEGAAATTTSPAGRRLRGGLVVAEIALAVVLVSGGGLLSRTLVAILEVDPGFEIEGLVAVPLRTPAAYESAVQQGQFARELVEAVERVPGVASAALAWSTPLGPRNGMRTTMVGDPVLYDEENPVERYIHPVTPDYLPVLSIEVTAGRNLEEGDALMDPLPVVLSQGAAEGLFGSADPIGQTVRPGTIQSFVVVGVVEGVHHWGLDQDVDDGVYVPYRPGGMGGTFQVLVRTDGAAAGVARDLRAAIWNVDPNLPLDGLVTMEQRVSESVASPRFLAALLGAFAGVALLLACGGVYASMLYTVGQRRREMGIRLALGATAGDVIQLVLRYGVALAALGIVLGTATALYLSRLMTTLVWGIETTDPLTFAGAAGVLAVAAVGASLVPAWRASRTDPLQTLAAE